MARVAQLKLSAETSSSLEIVRLCVNSWVGCGQVSKFGVQIRDFPEIDALERNYSRCSIRRETMEGLLGPAPHFRSQVKMGRLTLGQIKEQPHSHSVSVYGYEDILYLAVELLVLG